MFGDVKKKGGKRKKRGNEADEAPSTFYPPSEHSPTLKEKKKGKKERLVGGVCSVSRLRGTRKRRGEEKKTSPGADPQDQQLPGPWPTREGWGKKRGGEKGQAALDGLGRGWRPGEKKKRRGGQPGCLVRGRDGVRKPETTRRGSEKGGERDEGFPLCGSNFVTRPGGS